MIVLPAFPFKRPMLLDGSTGAALTARGMPAGVCVEEWILQNPEHLITLQSSYLSAGSDAVLAPTFGASRVKLARYGWGDRTGEINERLVALSKEAVKRAGVAALVAGNLSPTGLFTEPFGDACFSGLLEIYREQAKSLAAAGVDFFFCETMMGLTDARAALLASKECGLPVMVSFTVDENGKTLSGSDFTACLITLQAMGAAAVGLNCSSGPKLIAKQLAAAYPYAKVPLIAKPNSGMPVPGAENQFDLDVTQFLEEYRDVLRAGAEVAGGCCGTTEAYIRGIRALLEEPWENLPEKDPAEAAACETQAFFLSESCEVSPLIPCSGDMSDDIIEMEDEGYQILGFEIQTEGDAEDFGRNAYMTRTPVALYAKDLTVLDQALQLYQGRAFIKKLDFTDEELEHIVKKYGALIL